PGSQEAIGAFRHLVRRQARIRGELFSKTVNVEGKKNRYGAVGNARKAYFGNYIEFGECFRRCPRRTLGEARRRGVPINPRERNLRTLHLLRWRGTGDEQGKANKNGAFQSSFPRSALPAKVDKVLRSELSASHFRIQGSYPGVRRSALTGAWYCRKCAKKNDGERGQLDHVSSPDRAPEIIEAGGTARPHLTLATTDYDHVPNLASGAVCAGWNSSVIHGLR